MKVDVLYDVIDDVIIMSNISNESPMFEQQVVEVLDRFDH